MGQPRGWWFESNREFKELLTDTSLLFFPRVLLIVFLLNVPNYRYGGIKDFFINKRCWNPWSHVLASRENHDLHINSKCVIWFSWYFESEKSCITNARIRFLNLQRNSVKDFQIICMFYDISVGPGSQPNIRSSASIVLQYRATE